MKVKIPYFSLLWPCRETYEAWSKSTRNMNYFIKDLCIDKIIDMFDAEENERWIIGDMFCKICQDTKILSYRLDIMQDFVENQDLSNAFYQILIRIQRMKEDSVPKFSKPDKACSDAWLFETACTYINLMLEIKRTLCLYRNKLHSEGIRMLLNFVDSIIDSEVFISMQQDVNKIIKEFERIESFNICANYSEKRLSEISIDFDRQVNEKEEKGLVAKIIEKSKQFCPDFIDESFKIYTTVPFCRLEEVVLDKLKKNSPEIFTMLSGFYEKYNDYPFAHIFEYRTDINFYVKMSGLVCKMRKLGHEFCKPKVLNENNSTIKVMGAYDISLALQKKNNEKKSSCIVTNDYEFSKAGKIFVLTGPNQGGKTTFTRSVGIIQVLFQVGCYVPANYAAMSPVDSIYTHFPEDEVLGMKVGRLGEEAERISGIMKNATSESMILLNETFSSTRRIDGYHLGKDLLKAMMKFGCYGIFVTHFNELAYDVDDLNKEICTGSKLVSLMACIEDKENTGITGRRTYKIMPSKPNGLGYSRDIVLKYGLTSENLIDILKQRGYLDVKEGEIN